VNEVKKQVSIPAAYFRMQFMKHFAGVGMNEE